MYWLSADILLHACVISLATDLNAGLSRYVLKFLCLEGDGSALNLTRAMTLTNSERTKTSRKILHFRSRMVLNADEYALARGSSEKGRGP